MKNLPPSCFNGNQELNNICISSDLHPVKTPVFKIIIADHHWVVRRGMANIIADNWEQFTISFADCFDQVFSNLSESVDLLIVDVNMPGGSPFTMINELKRHAPDLKILVFSSYDESIYAPRFLQAGVNGYLHKNSDEPDIVQAIKTVLEGRKYASSRVKDNLLDALEKKYSSIHNPMSMLSNRELEIGCLLANGSGVLEISNMLNLQMGTVSTYKGRVFEKLRIKSVVELVNKFQLYQ